MSYYNNNVDKIKQLVTIQNIIDRYGYKPQKGFISCPFHNEKTPSLRIYTDTNTFYCFGCGMGGDVISFVTHLFKIDFGSAIMRLDDDFGLGLCQQSESRKRDLDARWKEIQSEKEKVDNLKKMYKDHYYVVSYWFRTLWLQRKSLSPKTPDEQLNPAFIYALHHTDYLEYWLDTYNTFEKWREVYG